MNRNDGISTKRKEREEKERKDEEENFLFYDHFLVI